MKKIYRNANILTLNDNQPTARAMGVAGGRICRIGSEDDVKHWGGKSTERIDLRGQTVIPGFIESHSHISIGAMFADYVNLLGMASLEAVFDAITAKSAGIPKGDWICGFGFDDTANETMRHLTATDLDAIATDRPIYILHISAHLCYLNSKGLEISGIHGDTPNPDGGHIDKNENGLPSGLLLENASFAVLKNLPNVPRSQFKKNLKKMIADYNAMGLTGTHDPAVGFSGEQHDYFRIAGELEREGELNLRIYAVLRDQDYDGYAALGLVRGFGSEFFRFGGRKYFQDGSIQGLTGALIDDYDNKPGWKGETIMPQTTLNDKFLATQMEDRQVVVHGNGDRAIESILQALEYAQRECPKTNSRHMLIHAQMASNDHLDRMAALEVIPSFFINHVYYWGDRHSRLFVGPKRAKRMNPLKSALDRGIRITMHSDYIITPFDPWRVIHTAVNRETREREVLGADERIDIKDALKAHTINSAYASFEENIKGTLEEGKVADFAVLDNDPLKINASKIKDVKTIRTVINGKTVYQM